MNVFLKGETLKILEKKGENLHDETENVMQGLGNPIAVILKE